VGLCVLLRELGKTAWLLPALDANGLFTEYLDGRTAPEGFVPETVISVDVASLGLLPHNAAPYADRIDLAIDHHPSNELFAGETCLEADKAACGEIIWKISDQLGIMTPAMADALYVAVSTDCGCFVYANTNPACHRVAAELMETGFDFYPINRKHFRTKSFKRLKLESMLTEGMELYDSGTIALVTLTLDMMAQLSATEEDIDDISAFIGQVEGVRTGITVRQLTPERCKISLRTDPGDLNASKVCALLGGGGHAGAAGASVDGSPEDAKSAIMAAIRQVQKG
jgi:phosphoesterase RecJ-like protein